MLKELFTEDIKREYFNALYNQQNGYNESMDRFKKSYPEVFKIVNAMYHKRKLIRDNIFAMKELNYGSIVFGALTYDNEHDSSSEANKRKQAIRHLNTYMDCYLFVEEYGN